MGNEELKELKKLREMKERVSGYGRRYRIRRKERVKELEGFWNKWNGKVVKGVKIE